MIFSDKPDPVTGNYHAEDYVRPHWEFIRRYMEDGPRELVPLVRHCLPISDRKETLKAGLRRLFANFSGASVIATVIMSPFFAWILIGRRIAVMTSKIPQWPSEIDAVCRVDNCDPFAIKANPEGGVVPDK